MEMVPPVGWAEVATRRDLDQLEQRISDRNLRAMADLRAEMFKAMAVQTRTLVITVLGATLGAVFTVARLV